MYILEGGSPGVYTYRKADLEIDVRHECTHALIDVFNSGGVTRHMDELASYVAQFVYTMRAASWAVSANGTQGARSA